MIEPYQVVGLLPTMPGVRYREPVERSVTPHDVWDRWIELHGDLRYRRDVRRRPS